MTATRSFRPTWAPGLLVLCVALARPALASDAGVDCAKLKLKATAKAVASRLKCFARGDFPNLDPECQARGEAQMARTFQRAELRECFGPQDDEADIRPVVKANAETLLAMIGPPHPCGLDADSFTCGGPCTQGRVCIAIGNTCGCASDAFACSATAVVPVFCPKVGQTCVDRACEGPEYCHEESAGSALGFCPAPLQCLWAAQAQCVSPALSCEDPSGACNTFGLPQLGLCANSAQTCGPGCLCQ
jgi:hypothetical protein